MGYDFLIPPSVKEHILLMSVFFLWAEWSQVLSNTTRTLLNISFRSLSVPSQPTFVCTLGENAVTCCSPWYPLSHTLYMELFCIVHAHAILRHSHTVVLFEASGGESKYFPPCLQEGGTEMRSTWLEWFLMYSYTQARAHKPNPSPWHLSVQVRAEHPYPAGRCVYPRRQMSAEAAGWAVSAEVCSTPHLHHIHRPPEGQRAAKSHDSTIWVSAAGAILMGKKVDVTGPHGSRHPAGLASPRFRSRCNEFHRDSNPQGPHIHARRDRAVTMSARSISASAKDSRCASSSSLPLPNSLLYRSISVFLWCSPIFPLHCSLSLSLSLPLPL